VRALGEPAGSRRLTGEQNTGEEPKQTVPPPSARRLQPPAHPRPSDEGDDDAAADERTSPFPYAEKFDEWVADETAASDGRQPRRDRGSRDAAS
jgi:hypothetical protein